MTRRAFAALLVSLLTLAAVPAFAGGRVVYRLALAPPADVLKADGDSKQVYAEMAKERLLRRFEAAQVKEAEFRVVAPTTLVVETGWDHQRGWMEALMTAPGRVEVRPAKPGAVKWLGLASTLPTGIELRGDHEPHLWSAKRSLLQKYLEKVAVPNGVVTVFPAEGGYRSVTLGETVATERQVKSVKAAQSATGAPFVSVDWETSVGASLAALHVSELKQIAIVLDGELVAFVPAKLFLDQTPVRLSVPEGAVPDGRKHRDLWVRQVAGRLAAPLPIPIAVLKE